MCDVDFRSCEMLLPPLAFDEIYVPRGITQQTVYLGGSGRQTEKIIYSPGDAVLRPAGDEPVNLIWPDGNSGNSLYIDPALYLTVGRDLLRENVRGVELCSSYQQYNPKLVEQIQKLYALARIGEPMAIEARLYSLIRSILTSRFTTQVQRLPAMLRPSPTLFQQVRMLINDNLDSKITLAFLAEMLDISVTRLTMQFKQTTDMSVHNYVLQVRLQKAQQLILKTNKSLTDIALETGFSSQAHLTTAFNQAYGITPFNARRQGKR